MLAEREDCCHGWPFPGERRSHVEEEEVPTVDKATARDVVWIVENVGDDDRPGSWALQQRTGPDPMLHVNTFEVNTTKMAHAGVTKVAKLLDAAGSARNERSAQPLRRKGAVDRLEDSAVVLARQVVVMLTRAKGHVKVIAHLWH